MVFYFIFFCAILYKENWINKIKPNTNLYDSELNLNYIFINIKQNAREIDAGYEIIYIFTFAYFYGILRKSLTQRFEIQYPSNIS